MGWGPLASSACGRGALGWRLLKTQINHLQDCRFFIIAHVGQLSTKANIRTKARENNRTPSPYAAGRRPAFQGLSKPCFLVETPPHSFSLERGWGGRRKGGHHTPQFWCSTAASAFVCPLPACLLTAPFVPSFLVSAPPCCPLSLRSSSSPHSASQMTTLFCSTLFPDILQFLETLSMV